jgi:hypothetical protein
MSEEPRLQDDTGPAYRLVDDPENCYSDYDVLAGPDGWECMLTEPEDRIWLRDLTPAWVDPTAMLFYGIAYDDDDELPADYDNIHLADSLARQEVAAPQPPNSGHDGITGPAWDAWRVTLTAWVPAQVNLRYRGTYKINAPFLCINESLRSVDWLEVAEIANLDVGPAWDADLLACCSRPAMPDRLRVQPDTWKIPRGTCHDTASAVY